MAESAVSFLLNLLATLTQEERQLLGRLDENVQDIQNQLEFMRAFLRVADAEEDGDPQLQAWVKQVREELERSQEVELKEFVKEFLSERQYIIVFDDVWSTRSWDALKHALPDKNMSSRVVLTTRTLDVANLASRPEYPGCHGRVHEMETLSYEDSWKLLCNKTFGDEIFPPHLQDCADGILDKSTLTPSYMVIVITLKEHDRYFF
ncbi:NBS domain resistance [Olea europaea subsp. europaea]|uniref:NBS domain resistance, partial n=1 Tax=Olea europaea subsp. europaea TaxID=158383 RepID=A0A8S0R2X7_OLEEU|nr:NBS domain resistance [Olea europaea subsp. europaea]